MTDEFIHVEPADIEATSLAIIESELPRPLDPTVAPVVKRVIHATADFDYVETLVFSPDAVSSARDALRSGVTIVTDTMMAQAGINQAALATLGGRTRCHMADPETFRLAELNGTTRAVASMDRASDLPDPVIFAIGNAPTALIRLHDLLAQGAIRPALIV
ncbi:MAG: precorrin-8X methylmutase, partial [Propionibacteriaceae bacterium]|nr:precorrin-8X methylmutase [Propionibacteriaceae bacterium]